ncbi:MAG: CRISPR-associated protein Cas4 [bacterium]
MEWAEDAVVLISALNEYAYCPRRCAFKHVEGVFKPNEHTLAGTLEHGNADIPGYETRDGAKVLRALPLSNARLGLSGRADWVEIAGDGTPYPVEMKHGRRKAWDNDDIQLCAQALCLEEMLGRDCPVGAIYHAQSRRRREVVFDAELRRKTEDAILGTRTLILEREIPAARFGSWCEGCSLREQCLPELDTENLKRQQHRLFEAAPWK